MNDLKDARLQLFDADGAEPARPFVGDQIAHHVAREMLGVDLDELDEFGGDQRESFAGSRECPLLDNSRRGSLGVDDVRESPVDLGGPPRAGKDMLCPITAPEEHQ